jgi:hypothetical protein
MKTMSVDFDTNIQQAVETWLHQVVIGLNLCPFAAKPASEGRVRFSVSHAVNETGLLADLEAELQQLDVTPVSELETTLVIVPDYLQDFYDYCQFLRWAESWLKRNGWRGIYQVASFHPNYCFAGAEPEDAENLTNRSPYPILHLIREESLAKALQFFPDIDEVPEKNKIKVASLSHSEIKLLFPYLFG